MKTRIFALALCFLLLCAACGKAPTESVPSAVTPPESSTSEPGITSPSSSESPSVVTFRDKCEICNSTVKKRLRQLLLEKWRCEAVKKWCVLVNAPLFAFIVNMDFGDFLHF